MNFFELRYDNFNNQFLIEDCSTGDTFGVLAPFASNRFEFNLHNPTYDITVTLNLDLYLNHIESYPIFNYVFTDKVTSDESMIFLGKSVIDYIGLRVSAGFEDFSDNNSSSTPLPFNYLDLNGNCGSFKNGTVVNVLGKTGDYIVKSSQFVWDDTTKKSSMVIYNLEKDGTMMFAPDPLVSLKVVP